MRSAGEASFPKHFRLSLPAGMAIGRLNDENGSFRTVEGPVAGLDLSFSLVQNAEGSDTGLGFGAAISPLRQDDNSSGTLLSAAKILWYGQLKLSKRFTLAFEPHVTHAYLKDGHAGKSDQHMLGGGIGLYAGYILHGFSAEGPEGPGTFWAIHIGADASMLNSLEGGNSTRADSLNVLQTIAALTFGM